MGLLEELTAKVTDALGGTAPGPGRTSTATAAAREDPARLVAGVLEMIDDPEIGGLAGLVKRFQERGLGDLICGWLSHGHGPPISPAQVKTVLDGPQLRPLAARSGVPLEALPARLAVLLPIVVDHLTPEGLVPAGGSLLNEALDWLDGRW